eukprot:CAMPEP_0118898084 /NCGR_PEP_ID=MMETSP1166-20130328/5217_1 /TAXON_ID=1104430 /ORGANISM="Chrysoreinhardia sp, Strain CCMP3193" /LENGTH=673 /DNA_ID=CAMNT_0006837167 /DNA_START=160 /DNA_END=2181 /DNA_ORIENTATION=-
MSTAEAAFVAKALTAKEEKKKATLYEGLVRQIEASDDDLSEAEVAMKGRIFEALGAEAPRLVRQQGLLEALFRAKSRKAPVLRGLGSALASVVSAKSTLVGRAFGTLLTIAATHGDAEGAIVAAAVHLLEICPRGTPQLFRAAKKAYPWTGSSSATHAGYVAVLVGLAERQTLCEPFVFELLVSRAIELDVSSQFVSSSFSGGAGPATKSADSVETTTKKKKIQPGGGGAAVVFELEIDNPATVDDDDDVVIQEEETAAAKLDAIMCLLFTYVDRQIGSEALFATALDVFEASVLHTHESKAVQFLFFKLATASADRAAKFAKRLVDVAADAAGPRVTRLSAVAYLASFLCRAQAVDVNLAAACADKLLGWAEDAGALVFGKENRLPPFPTTLDGDGDGDDAGDDYAKTPEEEDYREGRLGDGTRRNGGGLPSSSSNSTNLFAVIFQALLYVMCFRGDELLASKARPTLLNEARWRRLLTLGSAQGLRRCDPRVKAEFFDVCHRSNFFPNDFLAALRAVSGTTLPSRDPGADDDVRHGGDKDTTPRPVFFFFPFDPYLLPESKAFIASAYRHWTGASAIDDDDDDEEEEGEEEDDDEGDNDEDRGSPRFDGSYDGAQSMHLQSPSSFSPGLLNGKRLAATPGSLSPSVMSIDGTGPGLRARADSIGTRLDESW